MDDAAATLGKIYHVGGTEFAVPVIENEVQRAVELMTNDRAEHGRYAGILILTELATQASVPFWVHVNSISEKVVIPIRDSRVRAACSSICAYWSHLSSICRRASAIRPPYSLIDA